MSDLCRTCGQKKGECIEARDAGNFVIPVFNTPDGPSHWIPEGDLHLYDIRPTVLILMPEQK